MSDLTFEPAPELAAQIRAGIDIALARQGVEPGRRRVRAVARALRTSVEAGKRVNSPARLFTIHVDELELLLQFVEKNA